MRQEEVPAGERVFTHRRTADDISYRLCRCFRCGKASRCTPRNDFYTLGDEHHLRDTEQGAALWCEKCLMEREFGDKQPPMLVIDEARRYEVGDDFVVKGEGRRRRAVVTEVDGDGRIKSFDMEE